MRTSRMVAVGAVGIAAALALSACSSSGTGGGSSSGAPGTIGKVDGKGRTLTVWAMTGDLSDGTLKAINDEFKKQTGAEVKVQTQQWTDIATKITTALATSTPPDVLDIGNTQVATFASSGGLADLTAYKDAFAQGQTWLGGLADPATIDNKLYAVPSFAGARAVVYNKQVWAAAGITAAPTTYNELKADLDKLKAKNSSADFSAFYLPGQYWYAGMQWIWDAGGDIATQDGGKWKAGFSSDAAQQGLTEWKAFQNAYSSKASQTLNTDKPDQDQVFADGKAGAIIANGWEIGSIQKANPKLTNDVLGSFPMPGVSGKNQPVNLGGSDWGIAAKSKNQDLARVWVKIAASPDIQNTYVFGKDGWIPNSVEGSKSAVDGGTLSDLQKAFFTSAQNSKATPASGNWASLEDPGMKQFFQSIASGSKSPADAAKAWDSTVDSTLNQ
ncbi:sugar ABC transporter substrate-binding protein [Microbacterium sp.]|uniref:sugar ABC transporter substrate-binding protein n=1 Tax=Microbacterium sp. TaxID=51671 RepID=UPI00092BE830|nr:sugar ABC transporter substrate-binding protein [Microbacterium sp.]MBN9186209.1 sugar ABC transporter substrate-binding protein [Microbacterium sp.]MBN9192947.1 sugar ABC transporter substrate-binding protein [Microbacterium sp.]OJU63780.1 MAG: ABC transporter substrate-binding protein [Microbacterium sp. 70-38]